MGAKVLACRTPYYEVGANPTHVGELLCVIDPLKEEPRRVDIPKLIPSFLLAFYCLSPPLFPRVLPLNALPLA